VQDSLGLLLGMGWGILRSDVGRGDPRFHLSLMVPVIWSCFLGMERSGDQVSGLEKSCSGIVCKKFCKKF